MVTIFAPRQARTGCVHDFPPGLVRLLPHLRFAYRVAAAIPEGYVQNTPPLRCSAYQY